MADNTTIQKLKEEGFKEIDKTALRSHDYKEVIEYWDGTTWRDFAKK